MSKHIKELAYLRQLCCLGLPKETLIKEFLCEITKVIPSHQNAFSSIDPFEFKPADIILAFDVGQEMTQLIHTINLTYWTPELTNNVATWFKSHKTISEFSVIEKDFINSDMYNLIFRPLDQQHFLMTLLHFQGFPIGTMELFRGRNQKPFNTYEEILFGHLGSYLVHGLTASNNNICQYVDDGITGLLLMDVDGKIVFQSSTSKSLLMKACFPLLSLSIEPQSNEYHLLKKLAQMCRNLNLIFKNKEAQPPSFCHTNGLGLFIFTAHWLEPENREPGGLIGVTIEHQEPQVLKIVRALRDTPLSPTQKEVALLLAQRISSDEICQRLHIKKTTLKDHTGKIFTKLDISRREELLPLLLAKAGNADEASQRIQTFH